MKQAQRYIIILLISLFSFTSTYTFAETLKGTVVITGANRGIGLALAKSFIEKGYKVIGTARKPDSAIELKKSGAMVLQLDVTNEASLQALANKLKDIPIDILVNNAGVFNDRYSGLEKFDLNNFEWTFNVNTKGPVRVIKALLPNIKASNKKIVATVSSQMGSLQNNRGCCLAYRASKAAINSINQTLANDYKNDGLIFMVLHPGSVQTELNKHGSLSTTQSAKGMSAVISKATKNDNGKFYDWQGETVPW